MLLSLSLHLATTDNISSLFNGRIEAAVLRLDRIDRRISGNKLFKLKYYLQHAIGSNKKGIISFGGAWSNHLLAVAAACRQSGLESIGIIRGEEPRELSSTLIDAKQLGMQLIYISRHDYRDKKVPSIDGVEQYLVVPEGGYGLEGARGAAEILDLAPGRFTHYCCAVGTGTTMAGLVNGVHDDQQVVGINVMKNKGLEEEIARLVSGKRANRALIHDYHFGGYAKHSPELLAFMNDLYEKTHVPTDIVYTGKLLYAVCDLASKDYFPEGSKVLIIHSGGLQGNRSLPEGALTFGWE